MSNEKLFNYIILIFLFFIIAGQASTLYLTRNDSFSGVWIVRTCLVVLIAIFLFTFVFSAFFHRFSVDQIPSCASVAYFRFRWYIFVLTGISLAAIPVYMAILQRTNQNRLLWQFSSQIEMNLFTVLLSIGMDAFTRHMYQKQVKQQEEQNHPQAQQQNQPTANTARTLSPTNPQFGYFSPKSKVNAPITCEKNPFDSGKFRFAR